MKAGTWSSGLPLFLISIGFLMGDPTTAFIAVVSPRSKAWPSSPPRSTTTTLSLSSSWLGQGTDLQQAVSFPKFPAISWPAFEFRLPTFQLEASRDSLEKVQALLSDQSLPEQLQLLLGGAITLVVVVIVALVSSQTTSSHRGLDKSTWSGGSAVSSHDAGKDMDGPAYWRLQVQDLAEASAALSEEIKQLQAEKAAKDYEAATLQSELRTIQLQSDASLQAERVLRLELNQQDERVRELSTVIKVLHGEKMSREEELAKIRLQMNQSNQRQEDLQRQLDDRRQSLFELEREQEHLSGDLNQLQWQTMTMEENKRRVLGNLNDQIEKKSVDQSKITGIRSERDRLLIENGMLNAKLLELQELVARKSEEMKQMASQEAEKDRLEDQFARLSAEVHGLRVQLEQARVTPVVDPPASGIEIDSRSHIQPEQPSNQESIEPKEESPTPTSTLVTKKTARANKRSVKESEVVSGKETEVVSSNESDAVLTIEPEVASAKESEGVDDLTLLSQSSLNRKTLKDLQQYLVAKGTSIIDEDGKPLKKAALIQLIMSNQ